jgi:DUF4097 and DUF4098 domain-containing protein YvlB
VLGGLMILQAAVSFAGLLARHIDTTSYTAPAAHRLVIHSSSGTVNVTGTNRADIAGTVKRTWSFAQPQITTEHVGDALELSVSCGWNISGYCSAAFDLQVPAGTVVDLHTSSGDVVANGLHADATLSADSGRVSATDVVGHVTAGTSSGDVVIRNVTGDLDLSVDSGHIDVAGASASRVMAHSSSGDIDLALAADPQTVDAHADSGHVAVTLPDTTGVAYKLDLHADSGTTSGQVRTDPSSPRSITASASSGDVSVAYRS